MIESMPIFPINTNEESESKGFEEQFSNKLDINGVDAIKIEKEEENEKLPILFAPGWSRTQDTFKESLKVLHDCDRDVPRSFTKGGRYRKY